jgi:hypothetical protein
MAWRVDTVLLGPGRNPKVGTHDKPSHDLFDNDAPGGPNDRRSIFRGRQLAAQRLWRPWRGQPDDPRLRATGREGRRGRGRRLVKQHLGIDWVFVERYGRGRREDHHVQRFERRGRHGSRGRWAACWWQIWFAGRERGGIRRRCSHVYPRVPEQRVATGLSSFGDTGPFGRGSRIRSPGVRGAGLHRRSHEAAGTDDSPRRPVVAKEAGRRTRVTE